MDWIVYLPPLLSIYLILTSDFSGKYFKDRVAEFVSVNKEWAKTKDVIQNVGLDWAARLGFFNSMFASLVSVFSIYSATQSYNWAVGTFALLLAIFIPMFWWIMAHAPDQLAAERTNFLKITHARICSITLLIVNFVLIGAIAINQQLSP
jgi:hypothetical protein